MIEGVLTAADAVRRETGRREVQRRSATASAARCSARRWPISPRAARPRSARRRSSRRRSISRKAGDLLLFTNDAQLASLEEMMAERGYLDGSRMANVFNMMRPSDLIWPYIVNNYLLGKKPFPFDLLYWNQDSTRMPAANHNFYLREFYNENQLAKGEMTIAGTKLDLKKVKLPIYELATKEDHIAPAKSVFIGSQAVRRPGRVRARRLRPHRRRRQSARQGEVPVLDRRRRPRPTRSRSGWQWPRSTPAPGGRTGPSGSPSIPAAGPCRASRARRSV